jgi:outer membrane protein assembly factor BamA
MHRNLFRRGRGLSVDANASKFMQSGNVTAWWPAFIGSRTRAGTAVNVERLDEDSYELLRTGFDLFLTYRFSLPTSIRANLEVSNVSLDVTAEASDELDVEEGLLSVISLRWERNASDDRLQPTRGTASWILVQWAPSGAVSNNHFIALEASGAAYQPVGDATVLAVRARAGVAEPIGESVNLLPNVRFFSGGASSMRGFKRRRLGPLDESGDPIGGEVRMETAAELRFPLFWRLRGALFVDVGQVWERSNDTSPEDLAVAVGPGLHLATPVGPIRADFGYRVSDVDTDDPRWVFHIAIGPAF